MSETTPTTSGYKLDTPLRLKVLAMMARGEKYETIQRILKDNHGVEISAGGLSSMRKRHADSIKEMELMILEAETSEAEQVRVKTLRQLSRKLDRASADESELEELDRQYRNGEIESLSEYRRLKTGLLKLSVRELAQISKDMHAQSGKPKGASALPVGAVPVEGTPNPKWVEAMMLAVQRGDTIAMQQLVITPNA